MSAPRHTNCCLCGAPRRPTQRPVESFGNGVECIAMKDHRPLQEGRWEESPQMLVSVAMWRNGGAAQGQTHICDDCIVVGLKAAKKFVDEALTGLGVGQPLDAGNAQPRALAERLAKALYAAQGELLMRGEHDYPLEIRSALAVAKEAGLVMETPNATERS